MTTPLTSCNQIILSPSSSSSYSHSSSSASLSSAGPAKRVSICPRMPQSLNPLADYAGSSITTHQTSEYSTQSSSSAHPPTPRDVPNHTPNMADPAMTFGSWDGFPDLSFNMNWMSGSNLAADNGVAVSWKSVPERKPDIHGVLSMVETLLPPLPPTPANNDNNNNNNNNNNSVKETGAKSLVTASSQGKRSRSQQEHDNNEREKKRNAAANPHRRLGRPLLIPWEMRELKDEDFEYSCEWCPFFINQPFKYDIKPWNSCSKQRAESSHIVTHIVADHGIIRGHNSKRSTQRYLTKCATNDEEAKGKADCTLCSRVQTWTEEQTLDPSHAGKSVCLRCYEEMPNKRALYNHLHEQSICMYREDLPMRRKSRILYTTFCSSSDVPRFNPPPESGPRDGARKRNMKGNRSRSTDTTVTQPSNPGRAAPSLIPLTPQSATKPIPKPSRQMVRQPTRKPTQHWSPAARPNSLPHSQNLASSEFGGDRSGNYFPASVQPTQPPHPQQQQRRLQPNSFTQPAPPRLLISRVPPPSIYSDFDINPPVFNVPCQSFSQHLQLTQSELASGLVTTPVAAPPLQHSPGMQARGPIMGKHMYPANDSGYGSQNGGEPLQTSPFDDDFSFSSQQTYLGVLDSQYFNATLAQEDWR